MVSHHHRMRLTWFFQVLPNYIEKNQIFTKIFEVECTPFFEKNENIKTQISPKLLICLFPLIARLMRLAWLYLNMARNRYLYDFFTSNFCLSGKPGVLKNLG